MIQLPEELHLQIVSFVRDEDLLALRLSCTIYSRLISIPNPRPLRIWGPETVGSSVGLVNQASDNVQGPIEFSELPDKIKPLLPFAGIPKAISFGPGYYRRGFWDDYERGHDDDPDDPFIVANRETFARGRRYWSLETRKQDQRESGILDAIRLLMAAMTRLTNVDIIVGEVDGFETLSFPPYLLKRMLSPHESPSGLFANLIADGLYRADRNIEVLGISGLFDNHLRPTLQTTYMFSRLTTLSLAFTTSGNRSFQEGALARNAYPHLLEQCRETLCSLSIVFSVVDLTGGVLCLDNMFRTPPLSQAEESSESAAVKDDENQYMVFPRLVSVRLSEAVIGADSLIRFFSVQPSIDQVEFRQICLADPASFWPDLLQVLPDMVSETSIKSCGHDPFSAAERSWFQSPFNDSVNGSMLWNPFEDEMSLDDAGWAISYAIAEDVNHVILNRISPEEREDGSLETSGSSLLSEDEDEGDNVSSTSEELFL